MSPALGQAGWGSMDQAKTSSSLSICRRRGPCRVLWVGNSAGRRSMTADLAVERDGLRIVVVSGPVGAGKSTLVQALTAKFAAMTVRTQSLMADEADLAGTVMRQERRWMQEFGEWLDRDTEERWVAQGVSKRVAAVQEPVRLVIVDAVRTVRQVDALRDAFGGRVRHIHLHAPKAALAERYERREGSGLEELATYEEVVANSTESRIRELEADADVSIDTDRSTPRDVLARAIAALGLTSSRGEQLVDIVIGGQYGSEGKGNIAFHLAGEYDILMRVGGPNAGHKVPTDPAITHRLLPSGSLANLDAQLIIGPGATLDLSVLQDEIARCKIETERLSIDPQAMIIEESDITAEAALVASIGSTGRGGGAAAARRIMGRRGGGSTPVRLARDIPELASYVRPSAELLEDAYRTGKRIMLEGTQGTLLSLFHGFYPWVTSRDTTTAACLSEAGIGPHRLRKVVMVVRTFPIRVGSPPASSSGFMSQEIGWETIAANTGENVEVVRERETGSVTNTQRRVAEFDWDLLRRAAELNGATDVALTFTDYLDGANKHKRRFDQLTAETIQFVEEVARVAGAPVSLISTGFDDRPLIDRREW